MTARLTEPHVPGGVWTWLQEQVDPARYRPAAAPGMLVQPGAALGAAGWIKAAGLIGLVATLALAASGYFEYAGSRVAPAMALLAFGALALLFKEVNLPAAGFPALHLGGAVRDTGAGRDRHCRGIRGQP